MAKERRYRPRKQFQFWLYHDLVTDAWLMEIIALWKTQKQFAVRVKNGLRLMFSLGQGHTDVLFELFPQLETQLAAKYAPPPAPDTSNLERQIADLKQIILQQGSISAPPANYPQLKGASAPAPTVAVKAATVDVDAIHDNFMAFLQ